MILESCIYLKFKEKQLCLSYLIWGSFSYLRAIYFDFINKGVQGMLTIQLPDDFGEIFDVISSNPLPKDCMKCYDFAAKLREQALCLGLYPESHMNGQIESIILRLLISFSKSSLIQSNMELVWENRPSDIPWSNFFVRSLTVQEFVVNSMLPLSSPFFDLRNTEVLKDIKNAQVEDNNDKKKLMQTLANKILTQ